MTATAAALVAPTYPIGAAFRIPKGNGRQSGRYATAVQMGAATPFVTTEKEPRTPTRADLPTIYVVDDERAYRTPHAWRQELADNPSPHLERSRLLDRPTDPHPITDALMHDALRRLLRVADGASMSLTERVRGSAAGSSAPTSALARDMERLWSDYASCKTHRRRLKAIKAAQEAALRLQFSPDRSKVKGTLEWREAIAADSRSCRVVARIYGVDYSTVSRIRKRAGVAALAAG